VTCDVRLDIRAGLDDNLEVWKRDAHVVHAPPYDRFWADINKAVIQVPVHSGSDPTVAADQAKAAAAAAAAAEAEDHNFLCGSFLPLLERVHADFFSAVDGLVECLRQDDAADDAADGGHGGDISAGTLAESDLAPSVSSCGSSSSRNADVYRGFNLSELTSPLHKNILPHTVNILR
jgi:hypothetical protein